MPRQISVLEKDNSFDRDIYFALLKSVKSAGGNDEDVRRLINDNGLRKMLGELLVNRKVLTAVVDYDQLENCCGYCSDDYTYIDTSLADTTRYDDSLPSGVQCYGEVEVVYKYLTFDHMPRTYEVLNEIKSRGNIRRPNYAETRCFHIANPRERWGTPIVSLFGVPRDCKGGRYMACVHAHGDVVAVIRAWIRHGWYKACRFLVVRK